MAKQKKEAKQGISLVLEGLEKKYGLERLEPSELTIVNTGSLQLNQAMGVGGTALGKIVEIFGPESSGKSTIASKLQSELIKRKKLAYVLDGDNIRHGLNKDLSFSPKDRTENRFDN